MSQFDQQPLLYIWLDANPNSSEPDTTIADTPGVPDIDLIAEAAISGHFGRYLPVTIRYATHAQPMANKVRSVDTARLLRDRGIPHLRRYEIIDPPDNP